MCSVHCTLRLHTAHTGSLAVHWAVHYHDTVHYALLPVTVTVTTVVSVPVVALLTHQAGQWQCLPVVRYRASGNGTHFQAGSCHTIQYMADWLARCWPRASPPSLRYTLPPSVHRGKSIGVYQLGHKCKIDARVTE